MKQLFHLALVAFMAMNLTWGHDWVHVPGLLKHYQEHKAGNKGIGFLDFLAMHYTDAEHHDSEGSHDDLPFQHHKDHGGVDQVFFAPVMKGVALHLPTLAAGMRPQADEPLDGHRPSTLQPPRA